jgi:hypothetical protein
MYEYENSINLKTIVNLADSLCNQKFIPAMETNYYYTYTCDDKGKRLVVKKNLKLFWIEINGERPVFVYW